MSHISIIEDDVSCHNYFSSFYYMQINSLIHGGDDYVSSKTPSRPNNALNTRVPIAFCSSRVDTLIFQSSSMKISN